MAALNLARSTICAAFDNLLQSILYPKTRIQNHRHLRTTSCVGMENPLLYPASALNTATGAYSTSVKCFIGINYILKETGGLYCGALFSLFCISVVRFSNLDFASSATFASSTFALRSWFVLTSAFASLYLDAAVDVCDIIITIRPSYLSHLSSIGRNPAISQQYDNMHGV